MGDYKIIVDAGHGGEDPGAVSGNLLEKDFNLEAANYMYNRFKELGVPVAITREIIATADNAPIRSGIFSSLLLNFCLNFMLLTILSLILRFRHDNFLIHMINHICEISRAKAIININYRYTACTGIKHCQQGRQAVE